METVTSDWGDWLPRAVEAVVPDGVSLWYLGCNGFAVKDHEGTVLWIDPYCGTGDPPRTTRMIPIPFDPADVTVADALLATHEHTDHVHGATQAPMLAETGGDFCAPDDSLTVAREQETWGERWDVDEDQFREVSEGDSLEYGRFSIDVVEVNDPDATHPVGYVIEHDSGTIFHGGDTKPEPSFEKIGEEYDIDVAVVAFGSVGLIGNTDTTGRSRTRWYCDENEAVEVANALQADRLLPSHWDMWRGLTADPSALCHHIRSFDHPERVEVVQIGDQIDL